MFVPQFGILTNKLLLITRTMASLYKMRMTDSALVRAQIIGPVPAGLVGVRVSPTALGQSSLAEHGPRAAARYIIMIIIDDDCTRLYDFVVHRNTLCFHLVLCTVCVSIKHTFSSIKLVADNRLHAIIALRWCLCFPCLNLLVHQYCTHCGRIKKKKKL